MKYTKEDYRIQRLGLTHPGKITGNVSGGNTHTRCKYYVPAITQGNTKLQRASKEKAFLPLPTRFFHKKRKEMKDRRRGGRKGESYTKRNRGRASD